ncbi:hypothetical protein [Vibrio gallaecicus]|uniref:hypothetical protein n=1 Tax=Vibrio gallaecicus TaxID=552386 RepID=UPI00338E17E1
MTSRIPFYISIVLLLVAGIALSYFRHTTYGVPWTHGETRQVGMLKPESNLMLR